MAPVLTSLFNLGVNLVAVFIFLLAFAVTPTWTWLFLPVIVAILFVLTAATSMLISSLYVRYRDVAIIWSVAVTALFYGTPILYPFEIVPERFRDILILNPLTPLFAQARKWIIDPSARGRGDGRRMDTPDPGCRHFRGDLRARGVGVQSRGPRIAEEL